MSKNRMNGFKLLLVGLFLAPQVFAEQRQLTYKPLYDDKKLQASFNEWADSLDSLAVSSDYKKTTKDLLSVDANRQLAAIQTLGASADLRVIPWLVPFLNQENPTLRIWAGSSIEKIISAIVNKAPAERAKRAAELRPAAWISVLMFRKPDDGSTWAYAANIARTLRIKEFEHELIKATGSVHPATSNAAKSALEDLKGKAQ